MTRHHVDVAGRRLSWLQSGQGEPIVLLHAFPLSADLFQPQHEALPHGWTLITPDLRGLGASTGPPARSMDEHADDVLALLRHLGIERAIIGGLSMGGYVAFAVHRKAPQRFRGIVLADTRAEADTEEARANRTRMQQTVGEHGPAAIAEAMVPKLLGPDSRAGSTLPARVRQLIESNTPHGISDALEALKTRPDSTPTLSEITCPALVIVGADDELTPVAMSERLRTRLPRAAMTVVPGAGHLASLERPDAFNAALWEFLGHVTSTLAAASGLRVGNERA